MLFCMWQTGLANSKAVGVSTEGDVITFTKKSVKNAGKPAKVR